MAEAVQEPSNLLFGLPPAPASSEPHPWLRRLQRHARARFAALGLPTPALEAWKYTDVTPIASTHFDPAAPSQDGNASFSALAHGALPGLEGPQLVFVNGHFAPRLSRVTPLPSGVRVESLETALATDAAPLEAHLGRYANIDANAFAALNTALFSNGALVVVPPRTVLQPSLHLLHVASASAGPIAFHPRTLIVAGERSQVTVVESFAGISPETYFTNAVTELVAGEGAVVDHYTLQQQSERAYHVGALEIRQGRASTVTAHSVALGGALVRNEVNARFEGEGGELALNGLYATTGTQHVDNHTFIDHAAPRCTSREFYKGVLDGTSRGVFYGKILVRKDAQKTNAGQTNKNLLLSGGALVDSVPALEINADDVKCTHGASIGQLDRDHLFYLESRGIDPSTARALLTYGFAWDVLARIGLAPVRAKMNEILLSRLPGGPAVREVLHDIPL